MRDFHGGRRRMGYYRGYKGGYWGGYRRPNVIVSPYLYNNPYNYPYYPYNYYY